MSVKSSKRVKSSQPTPQQPQSVQVPFSPPTTEHDIYLDDDDDRDHDAFLCEVDDSQALLLLGQNTEALGLKPPPIPPVEEFSPQQHALGLCRELGEMMLRGEFCDLTLVTETSTIPVHVCVVAACSQAVGNYLKQSPIKYVKLSNLPGLTDIQKRALNDEFVVRNLMCDYAYFGHFSAQVRSSASAVCMLDDDDGVGAMERTVRLLAGAIGLGISGAVQGSSRILMSRIDVANGLLIYSAAWDLGCTELERVAETFVDANFPLVCLEQSWIDASDDLLSRILCRDELNTGAGEMEVFRAISRWAFEDFASRQIMVEAMLNNPRILRVQYLSDGNLADLFTDSIVLHFAHTIKRMLEGEVERRRLGQPCEVNVPCRYFEASPAIVSPQALFCMDLEASPRPAHSVVNNIATNNQNSQLFRSIRVLPGHEKAVCSLAANERWVVSGSQDHTIRVWDLETNSTKTILRGHTDSVSVLRFFPNGQLISGSFDRSIRVWDDANGWKSAGFVAPMAHDDPITCLMVISRTNQLASGTSGGEIKIWSLLPGGGGDGDDSNNEGGATAGGWGLFFMLQNAHAHVLWSCCEWGDSVVTGSSDTEIRVWDSSTWELRRRLQFHKDEVQALLVIGDELYSGSDDGVINVYRTNADSPVRTTSLGRAIMAFSELDSNLVVGLGDGGILVLHAKELWLVAELKSHASSVMALAVVTKRHLVSGSFDKTVRVWERNSSSTAVL
ncbi:hypothetical protein BASA81_000938 [Batrachochytrium salamandrivorans]|nr:hypothetical protein BASA81_000938 [Batrachochytrium salamandrivorans]